MTYYFGEELASVVRILHMNESPVLIFLLVGRWTRARGEREIGGWLVDVCVDEGRNIGSYWSKRLDCTTIRRYRYSAMDEFILVEFMAGYVYIR